MIPLALRILASIAGLVAVSVVAHQIGEVNSATIGFAYLVLILIIASTWGFVEAACGSIVATLAYNFFFLPPIGTFTIADPQNWIALFSFLTTSLIASRLSTQAKERAREAIDRQQDLERLYTFSRAILLFDTGVSFPKELSLKLAEIFNLNAVVLFDRPSGEFYRAGPADFDGLDEQLRDAALNGTAFSDPDKNRTINAVRLGSEPIASLALQGQKMPDAVLQGISNLVAIGLERAKAQDLAHQIEAAKQSERLRTTLIDAMAHEFKTPLTSIKAATTSILSAPDQPPEMSMELIRIADEEAEHLKVLIDNALEMARLDTSNIEVQLEPAHITKTVREVVASMAKEIAARKVEISFQGETDEILMDERLVKLAIKQLIDNALKYSSPSSSLRISVHEDGENVMVDVIDQGQGIPSCEQDRVFQRFWRSPSVQDQIPGTGLGLSIAHGIARAHSGDLTLTSRPGETTFRLTLPMQPQGETVERRAHSRYR